MTTKQRTKQKETIVTIPIAPRIGRPPLGTFACEARWHVKASHADDALLKAAADRLTGGDRSKLIRLAVRSLAESTLGKAKSH